MNGLNGVLQADKLVQERYEKLVLGLRALEVANEKQEIHRTRVCFPIGRNELLTCFFWCQF